MYSLLFFSVGLSASLKPRTCLKSSRQCTCIWYEIRTVIPKTRKTKCLYMKKGCALAGLKGPLCLAFALRRLGNLHCIKIIRRAPWISQVQNIGLLTVSYQSRWLAIDQMQQGFLHIALTSLPHNYLTNLRETYVEIQ